MRTKPVVIALGLAALAVILMLLATSCGGKSSGGLAKAKASASALSTNPAVVKAESTLGTCLGQATSAVHHKYRTFKDCVHTHFPKGGEGPLVTCSLGVWFKDHGNQQKETADLTTCAQRFEK